jgi:hypothetical protein
MAMPSTAGVWLLSAAVVSASSTVWAQGADTLLSGNRRIVQGYAEPIDPAFTITTSVTASGAAPIELPCRLFAHDALRALIAIGWERSASFRQQCRRLALAGAVVLLQQVGASVTPWNAESRIGTLADGHVMARVRVRDGRASIEVIAHELEHVLERIDGVNLAFDAMRRGSGTTLAGGAYETRRATRAGQQVAGEVALSTRRARRMARSRRDARSRPGD